ncbi:hypothetical protein PHYBLDRAFT_144245 [Phycomyces blakesleeanus NRRL 1555(-)]|uniref:Uncharacterized protein n=1 Tax=Phycomyces blakesleeanus (strain ATCC 8743b / DSM 1359 / FGSC 10004 / NBRC 33097 / NRRL 1555) TaxID=763407 RepID=A0A167N3N4_PHYB8|nr:hypothetical protein PHYBLDRAFT_144245 [Phycomyces blakesleeanus NRRL 1555(-)]OAD74890.1 hypothetical protein PHYBLDRAFT_144245 [Phycomyces blakesleeanus NRRL 1555(-)]|eukprot:XP_018292930.1 hypothetical protein PHYBLDRAFT_144245 [Phycomyces blakesleeanus NRRL 1555(-)]
MSSFGENDKVTMPQLSTDEVEHVLVTHDESTFYSNDRKEAMWLVEVQCLMQLESNAISLFEVIHPGYKKWKLDCKNNASEDSKYCAHHFLASRPDFMSQKTALDEAIEVSGHIFELYPKFHCECNWIERYWGTTKCEAQLLCDYTYKSLDKNIHSFFDHTGKLQII